jgi:hypothetical protein
MTLDRSVLTGVIAAYVVWMAIILTSIAVRTDRLPHRPVDQLTNWGQGRNPDRYSCRNGVPFFDAETGLFVECMEGTQ